MVGKAFLVMRRAFSFVANQHIGVNYHDLRYLMISNLSIMSFFYYIKKFKKRTKLITFVWQLE